MGHNAAVLLALTGVEYAAHLSGASERTAQARTQARSNCGLIGAVVVCPDREGRS